MKVRVLISIVFCGLELILERQFPLATQDFSAQFEDFLEWVRTEICTMALRAADLGNSSPQILVAFSANGDIVSSDILIAHTDRIAQGIQGDKMLNCKVNWLFYCTELFIRHKIARSRQSETG